MAHLLNLPCPACYRGQLGVTVNQNYEGDHNVIGGEHLVDYVEIVRQSCQCAITRKQERAVRDVALREAGR